MNMKELEKAKDFFDKKGFIVDETMLKATLSAIKHGKSIFAVGPTGSGKTHFYQLLAEHLKGAYHYQSLNGSVTIHDLTQERILGKDGKFEERDMVLANWLRDAKKGVSFLQLDEVNAAKPETLLALHPIMDIKGELELPYTQEVLKVTNNAIIVMSCNEGDEYHGINAMNMAFLNRMGIKVHFDYIQGEVLAEMLSERYSVDIEQTRQVVSTWESYMASRDPEEPVVSIRVLENWVELSKDLGLKTAGIHTFGGLISTSSENLIEIAEGTFFVNLKD